MIILFYIEHFRKIGGAENYAISLCKQLYERGYEIHVICNDGEKLNGIKIHSKFQDIKYDISFDWGLLERADISRLGGSIHKIYINYALYSNPMLLRPVKWLLYRVGKHRKKIRHQEYVLSSLSTIYIAPSEFVKRHAIEYGIPEKRIRVIYNGVDLRKFLPESRAFKKAIRKRWGIKEDEVVFLFIAHNLRLKNLKLLRKVFDSLYSDYPIKLMVTGKKRPDFNAPYLIYTGSVQDMRQIYAAGDVLLHPSYFDTFGCVVIEAMASGLPVIVSRFAGASEIVEDAGLVLPVVGKEVVQLWKDSIKKMLNSDLRLDMGYRARIVAEKYDFSSYVDKIEEVINSI